MYTIRQANPKPTPARRRGRPGGAASIQQIQIHATRGPTPMDRQVQATENTFGDTGYDRAGGWGPSADWVVGPDHREGGNIVIVQFGDPWRTFSSWSSGYGSHGAATEYGAAEIGAAIEVAQPPKMVEGRYVKGDSDVPFTMATIDAVAWLCNHINDELVRRGGDPIPPVRILHWSQKRDEPIPRGFIGHEDLANGVRLGKTDPGVMWPWDDFLMKVGVQIEPISPPISNRTAALAAWRRGVHPLPMEEGEYHYDLRIPRNV